MEAQFEKILKMFFPAKDFYPMKVMTEAQKQLCLSHSKRLIFILNIYNLDVRNVCCSYYHDNACYIAAIQKIAVMARSGWKIYAIIHFTTFILFKSRKLHKKPLKKIAKALYGLFKSLAFSATYGYWITWSLCYVTKFNKGRLTGWNSTIMAFCAVPSLYCEALGRRNEIVMYLVPRTLESLKIFLEKRKLLPQIPLFLPIMSAFTWAIIADTHAEKDFPLKKTFK